MTYIKIGSTNLGEPQALQRWEKILNGVPQNLQYLIVKDWEATNEPENRVSWKRASSSPEYD